MSKKPQTYGAYGRNHPASVRWMVDFDYLDKLTDEERAWLAEFSDCHYGADFRHDPDKEWSTEERRATYIRKNAANADLYTAVAARSLVEPLEERPDLEAREMDVSPLPRYLDTPEYKDALKAYRETLSQGRKPAKPKLTPEHSATLARLDEIVNGTSED